MDYLSPYSRFLADEAATLQLGKEWLANLDAPLVIYLHGDLGAGKTTLTRGLLRGLGYQGVVKSPTYAIVESYQLNQFTVHHFDLYRFASPNEWEDAGLDDLITNDSICLIEWPQQGGEWVPAADLSFSLNPHNEGRICTITAQSESGKQSLNAWQN